MRIENGVDTIFDILSIPFKDIEDIECRINNKCIKLNLANINRLKILKSFHMHNEQTKTPLNLNDWLNLEQKVFVNFHLYYQEKDYNMDASQSASAQSYLEKSIVPSKYNPVQQFSKDIHKDIKSFSN